MFLFGTTLTFTSHIDICIIDFTVQPNKMCYINERDPKRESKSVEVQAAVNIEGKTAETQTTMYSSHDRQTQTIGLMMENEKHDENSISRFQKVDIMNASFKGQMDTILPVTARHVAVNRSLQIPNARRKLRRKAPLHLQLDEIRNMIYQINCKLGRIQRGMASSKTKHIYRKTRRTRIHEKFRLKAKKIKRRIRHDAKRSVKLQSADTKTGVYNSMMHKKQFVDLIYQKYLESIQRKERSKHENFKIQKHLQFLREEHSLAINSLTAMQWPLKEGKRDELTALKQHLFQRYLPYPKVNVVGMFHPMTLDEHFRSRQNDQENSPSTTQAATSMNIEMLRLETYKTFPLSSKARPIHLAKCGFFYTGRGYNVECFSCGVRHNDWTETDKVFEVHRRISPSCRFMLNQDDTNVPISPPHECPGTSSGILPNRSSPNGALSTGNGVSSESHISRRDNNGRGSGVQTTDGSRNTSHGSHLDGNVLSANSLQNTENSNIGSLGPGQGQGQSGTRGESVPSLFPSFTSNRSHSSGTDTQSNPNSTNQSTNQAIPNSSSNRYISSLSDTSNSNRTGVRSNDDTQTGTSWSNSQNSDNAATSTSALNASPSTTQSSASNSNPDPSSRQAVIQRLDPLGINFDRPRYPAYAILNVRISSFQNWPAHKTQTPRQMAMAGFLYAGYGDYARCFFCGGGLRNWEDGDDPWVEHARWFPRCAFLRQNKGDQFVALVQEQHQEEVRKFVCFVLTNDLPNTSENIKTSRGQILTLLNIKSQNLSKVPVYT